MKEKKNLTRPANEYTYLYFCKQAALMTGRYTFLTGMQFGEIQSSHKWGLPLEEVTLGDRFKAAGYATHMVSGAKMLLKHQKIRSSCVSAGMSSY